MYRVYHDHMLWLIKLFKNTTVYIKARGIETQVLSCNISHLIWFVIIVCDLSIEWRKRSWINVVLNVIVCLLEWESWSWVIRWTKQTYPCKTIVLKERNGCWICIQGKSLYPSSPAHTVYISTVKFEMINGGFMNSVTCGTAQICES